MFSEFNSARVFSRCSLFSSFAVGMLCPLQTIANANPQKTASITRVVEIVPTETLLFWLFSSTLVRAGKKTHFLLTTQKSVRQATKSDAETLVNPQSIQAI